MNEEIKHLGEVFEPAVKNFPNKLALKKETRAYTFAELKTAVVNLKNHLLGLGLKRGDKFSVYGDNSPEWAIGYLGIVRAGLVAVPLDYMSSEAEMLHILRNGEARGIIVADNYLEKIDAVKGELPNLKHIIPMSNLKDLKTTKERSAGEIDPDSVAVLIFTSGTTGTSKAVMLSHNNIISNMRAADQVIHIDENDTMVSIIPMHHTFEGTCGFLFPLFKGTAVYYPPSLKPTDLLATMKEAKVSCLIAVPLLFEKFVGAVQRKVTSAGLVKKAMFNTISGIGSVFKFLRKPLFARVRKEMGLGNIRIAVAGGAALTEKVAHALELMGIPILQGYGLTETSPVLSVSPLEKPKVASVGILVPGVEGKIVNPDENGVGEIAVRGSNVMLGYYKNQKATDEVLKDGWFYTGDLGYFDSEGYLYITGRKKSIIVTQTGKNIYPEELEEKLVKSMWINEVLVVPRIDPQTKKESIVALIYPNYELLEQYSAEKGITMTEEEVKAIYKEEINQVNEGLPVYKKITQFEIRDEEFPKTTTKKIKRHLFVEMGVKV